MGMVGAQPPRVGADGMAGILRDGAPLGAVATTGGASLDSDGMHLSAPLLPAMFHLPLHNTR